MCGIIGALSLDTSRFRVSESYLNPMRDMMAHRGPDGGSSWFSPDGVVGLGHRRLSIIDLSTAADQPMCNEDGTLWIVLNGEIYNHPEIRAELEALGGHSWKTDHSDTEVVLHAFEQWGIDCLHKFRGMFAIGIWHSPSRELWLVRDRIGVKPLYYTRRNDRLVFASEIKAILKDPSQPREVNREGLLHYLSFLTTPAPQTLFAGIHKLPPGTWMRVSADGSIREHRYWDLWDHVQPRDQSSEDDIAAELLSELRTAVQLRKVSDVPVGVFLSGGIDSSTNAALFSEDGQGAVKTFSIGYKKNYASYQNELEFARMAARHVGAEHHEKLLDLDDLVDFLPRLIHLQDEPIGDPVCFPVYYVSQLARENGVIVCQVGEGADELFWGYPTWKLKLRLQQLNNAIPLPAGFRTAGHHMLRAMGKGTSHEAEALRRAGQGLPIFWGGVDAFTEAEKTALISPAMRKEFQGVTAWNAIEPIWNRYREKAWEKSPLNWMSYLDLSMRLPELLLMRVDKMSMGVSLEGRVPFLDYRFVELAMSIPQRVKTRNGTLKYILKKAVRGLIPDEIIDRPKQGFGVPVTEWCMDRLGDVANREISRFTEATGLLDPKGVEALLRSSRGSQKWYILNLALWWKHYIEGEMPESVK